MPLSKRTKARIVWIVASLIIALTLYVTGWNVGFTAGIAWPKGS